MSKPVAVVVGAGPGLGSALARRFAVAGMAVAVARRRIDELAGLAEETGGRAYACDATDRDSVEALFDSVERDLGTPALVAYNAGAYQRGGILEISADDFERCWRIGCLGGFHV
ncbi:MAG: SDR family NAD(P)-dependent oxidoreductase, partial [Kiloniellales bacterium]